MLPTGFRTFHFVSFLYFFFFSFLFLLFRFFSHYFVFVFFAFRFFRFFSLLFSMFSFRFLFLSVSFRFFSFFSVSQFTGTLINWHQCVHYICIQCFLQVSCHISFYLSCFSSNRNELITGKWISVLELVLTILRRKGKRSDEAVWQTPLNDRQCIGEMTHRRY